MKKVAIFLAEGFEILEAMGPVDILRRGKIQIDMISINSEKKVNSSQGIFIEADKLFSEIDYQNYDMIILPGGYPGFVNLGENKKVLEAVEYFAKENKFIGAICGAPTVLKKSGLLEEREFVCHSSVVAEINSLKYKKNTDVVTDKNLITATGAGHSLEFGFALLEILNPSEVSNVKKGMEL